MKRTILNFTSWLVASVIASMIYNAYGAWAWAASLAAIVYVGISQWFLGKYME